MTCSPTTEREWFATPRGERKHRDPNCRSLLPATDAKPLDDLDRSTHLLRPCTMCSGPDSEAILEEVLGR